MACTEASLNEAFSGIIVYIKASFFIEDYFNSVSLHHGNPLSTILHSEHTVSMSWKNEVLASAIGPLLVGGAYA